MTKQMGLNLSDQQYGKLVEMSKRDGIKVTHHIKQALEEYFERHFNPDTSVKYIIIKESGVEYEVSK
jgi:hypothetical protein